MSNSLAERSQKRAKWSVATRRAVVALISSMGLMTTTIQAATNLVGTWSGSTESILVGNSLILPPTSSGNFMDSKQIRPMLAEDPKPQIVKGDVRIIVADQSGDLLHGVLQVAGRSHQHFVCTFVTQDELRCATDTSTATMVLNSPTEAKVCFIERDQKGKSAGCSVLTKTK